MALQIPGYQPPTPYASQVDILTPFAKGYDLSTGIINEQNAKQALGDFVKSLYTSGAPVSAPQPTAAALATDANPVNQLVGGSAVAAENATDPVLAKYFATLSQRESGNNPNAQNSNSSAGGLYQITDPTWQALVAQNPTSGLTADGKMDPAQQQTAVRLLTQQNIGALKQAGQPVNPGTLYAAHFLGAPEAVKVLSYADTTPMSAAVSPDVLQANPNLADMNVGQFKQWAGVSGANPQGGYRAPVAGPNGLPPPEVLTALFQNPNTREFAAKMVAPYIDPAMALDLQSKRADIGLKQAQTSMYSQFGGKIPPGYSVGPNGTLIATPGGPADPNNPLNYNKVNPFGQTVGADGSGGAATADSVPVQLGPNGKPDPQQQADYIKTLPANLQPLVQGVVNYTLDPNKVVSLKGNARTQLIAAAKAADPSFDMAQYPARAAMVKSLASGQMQQTLSSVNTTIQHLGELDNEVNKLGNGSFTPWNTIAQSASAMTGHPEPKVYSQTAQAAANEMAKFFKGAGATDVGSIREWQDSLHVGDSPEQQHAVIKNAIANLLQAKLNTLQEQYRAVMGGGTLPGFLSSQSIATLQKLGVDPASLDPEAMKQQAASSADTPQEGMTAINPQTQQRIVFKGGAWVDAQTGQPIQ